jgi:GNAT superfamily N-acetyltransferase
MTAASSAVGFGRRLLQAVADEVEELPFGLALRTPSLPAVHNLNRLQVVGPHPGLTVTDLVAQLDAHVGAAFADVLVEDDATAARLEPAFRADGFETGRELVMILTGGADRPPGDRVQEVGPDVLDDARFWTPSGLPEAHVEQLLERDRRMAAATGERGFAVLGDDGRAVAKARLRVLDGVAQVEDVIVLPEHRGQGHGRAVAAAATEAARAGGHETVFLFAAGDDWPRELYAKLGFEPAGAMLEALRREAQSA